MSRLQELSEAFRFQYEKFVNGCAALEEQGLWDDARSESMETYYYNDIMCVILSLISADGTFSDAEAEYINEIFGFTYTPEELRAMYSTEGRSIRTLLTEEVPAGWKRLTQVNSRLAAHYRDMLFLVCDIIAGSDGIRTAESKEIQSLRDALAN